MNSAQTKTLPADDARRGTEQGSCGALCSASLHVLGESIVNGDGVKLGSVDDLLIFPSSACIAYVVMVWGGFMGRGERQLVLPWRALQHDAVRRVYVLDADEQRLADAPCINRDRWPAQATQEWHMAVHRHYDTLPHGP